MVVAVIGYCRAGLAVLVVAAACLDDGVETAMGGFEARDASLLVSLRSDMRASVLAALVTKRA